MLAPTQATERIDALLVRMADEGWAMLTVRSGDLPRAQIGDSLVVVKDWVPSGVTRADLHTMVNHLLAESDKVALNSELDVVGRVDGPGGARFGFHVSRSLMLSGDRHSLSLVVRAVSSAAR